MRNTLLILALSAALAACGQPDTPPVSTRTEPAPPPAQPAPAPQLAPEPENPAGPVEARMKVVDLEGRPLVDMIPIATRQPNAFDEPVAAGNPTGAGGEGRLRFPSTESLFLRAWDPALKYFPNNFYEVLPGGGAIQEELTVQMVPAAALEAQFQTADGAPLANEEVRLMLVHSTRGPWWPARTRTSALGQAIFPSIPPGEFLLHFETGSGARIERGTTALPPGEIVGLGVLVPQP